MLPDYRVRQRDYLLEISRALTQELDLDKLLERILVISAEMLAGQAGLIALRSEGGRWTVASVYGIPSTLTSYLDPLLANVPDHDDPRQFELPEINRILQEATRTISLGLLTGVGLPLIVMDRVIGVIFIFRNYRGVFSANDRALLQSFADQAAVAVNNARLYSQITQEKQRLDALLDSAADGILILSPEHTITRCNPAFAHFLGVTPQRLIGESHEDVVVLLRHGDNMTLEQAEAGGWPLTPKATLYVEGDLKRSEGVPLPVGITYAPLTSPEGGLVNIIATVRDITRFREAEEIKSTFISVISHELKTPVALIKGYVGTLRREDASWDREIIEDSLKVIEEEADRLTTLIENLLDASRLQAGGIKINLCDIDLKNLAERVAERFRTQTSHHKLSVDFSADFPIIVGDEERLGQVFSNLISNAIKYSPSGGEIRIAGQVRADAVIVCITDQGTGVAPGDMPHIFDRFSRSQDATR
ncbi:MAG TPA: histidine kinase dimerization/phospho-acceptor domain-containing protein, partial [Anaerolineales bacterium]|nr:histidine kinase dimerization/phospho-acceptor domain-containing protein [Anaerolineales bacterium]